MANQLTNYLRQWLTAPDEVPYELCSLLWLESENLLTPEGQSELQALDEEFPELEALRAELVPAVETSSTARTGFTVIRGSDGLQPFRGSRRVDTSLYQMARSSAEPVVRVEQQLDGSCGRISVVVQEDIDDLWGVTVTLQAVSPEYQGQNLLVQLIGHEDSVHEFVADQEVTYDALPARQYGIEISSNDSVLDFFPLRLGDAQE